MFKKLAQLVLLTAILVFTTTSTTFAQEKVRVSSKPVEPFYSKVAEDTPKLYEPKVTYLSPEKAAPIKFSSVGATWKQSIPAGTSLLLEIRLKSNGKYSDWYPMEPVIDEKYDLDHQNVSSFLTTNLADGYQYRITLNSTLASATPVLDDLEFTFINGGTPQDRTNLLNDSQHNEADEFLPADFNADQIVGTAKIASTTSLVAAAEPLLNPTKTVKTTKPIKRNVTSSNSKVKIISRAEWGADESLRLYTPSVDEKEPDLVKLEDDYYTKYASELKESKRITTDDKGNLLTWPLSYPESIKKIVIHHTATTKDLDDPKKAIRDIYVWHTKSKGWGDIGYNYIIDQQGNIYEGRYGGEMVVGAHAGRGNHGSIGIAVLGNYQDQDPPEAVINALTSLIKEKAKLYNIDTEGASLFRGENYPNVMGHRDIMSTSCPGDKLYAMLPVIRKLAKASTTSQSTSNNAQVEYDLGWASGSAPIISIDPKGKKTFSLKIKNTGKKAWPADTYFRIRNTANAQTFLRNSEEILSGTVGKEIQPGATAEVKILANAKATSGSSLIEMQPVINGKTIERSLSFGLQITSPKPKAKYDYELVSIIYSKTEFKKGDMVGVTVKLRNKGTSPWQKSGNNKVMLGADKPQDHKNNLLSTPSNRLAGMNEDLVQSGQIASFNFNIKVPQKDGLYKEYFTPVVEGIQWMSNHNSFIQVKVGNSDKLVTPEFEGEVETTPVKTATVTNTSGGSNTNIASSKLDTKSVPRSIRVDLSYRGNPATISASGKFALYEGSTKKADFSADQMVVVEYSDNTFKVTGDGKSWTISGRPRFVPANRNVIMRIENWERRNTWGDKANNNQFRGTLEVLIYDKELHVINELALEDYLRGIAEESSSEPDDKIKTIMVIARTYARFYMDVAKKFPGAPFDLNDDPNYSQKYLGYAFEARSAKTANLAAETAGQYVTYQGKLIKTPYFSKSDGKKTIAAKDKWGWTDTPFLASVDDSYCQSTAFSGHGVGLSGCGATALAQMGKTYQEIIKYYYQGTEVTQAAY